MGNSDLEDEVEANYMESNIIPLAVTTARDECPSIELNFLLNFFKFYLLHLLSPHAFY